jgi:hypothetical protein
MPQNKDFKSLVRARMAKTGEGYSVARMHLLKQSHQQPGSSSAIARIAAAPSRGDDVRPGTIFQLRLSLKGISPLIWRRVQVPAEMRLSDLSRVLLEAMGWTNSHLHEFNVDGTRIGMADLDEPEAGMPEIVDETTVSLGQLAESGARTFEFLYDFGDCWEHSVEIESVDVTPASGVLYPSCTGGERACPPEDCGGTSGYERMLEILADPTDDEHDEMRVWVGGRYDAKKFDIKRANTALRRLSPRRPAVSREKKQTFVEVLVGKPIQPPAIPEQVRLLFVDWALEQYVDWCTKNGKKVAITRAEVAFPGPFMQLAANRRSFYFAWDRDHGRGIAITRSEYPRAKARSTTFSVVPMGGASASIGTVRRMLSGQLAAAERN